MKYKIIIGLLFLTVLLSGCLKTEFKINENMQTPTTQTNLTEQITDIQTIDKELDQVLEELDNLQIEDLENDINFE